MKKLSLTNHRQGCRAPLRQDIWVTSPWRSAESSTMMKRRGINGVGPKWHAFISFGRSGPQAEWRAETSSDLGSGRVISDHGYRQGKSRGSSKNQIQFQRAFRFLIPYRPSTSSFELPTSFLDFSQGYYSRRWWLHRNKRLMLCWSGM